MSTEGIWRTSSTSSDDTLQLAMKIGQRLEGGEVFELISDLGGGKTTFVKGLAAGMGSKQPVTSPSFTLSQEYPTDKLVLHHFDFYRLREPGIMKQELAEILDDPQAVVAVEWADQVEDVLPDEKVFVRIKATGEDDREITFDYPKKLNHLFPNT